jgi:hypothetical protein
VVHVACDKTLVQGCDKGVKTQVPQVLGEHLWVNRLVFWVLIVKDLCLPLMEEGVEIESRF